MSGAQGTKSNSWAICGARRRARKGVTASAASQFGNYQTSPLPASLIIPAIFWSRAVLSSVDVHEQEADIGLFYGLQERRTLKCSMPRSILPERRMPAVSIISAPGLRSELQRG